MYVVYLYMHAMKCASDILLKCIPMFRRNRAMIHGFLKDNVVVIAAASIIMQILPLAAGPAS